MELKASYLYAKYLFIVNFWTSAQKMKISHAFLLISFDSDLKVEDGLTIEELTE